MSGVTEQDRQLYGEELPADAQRWAQEVVDRRVGQLEHQLGQVQSRLGQTQTQLTRERVQAALDRDPELRDWRRTNEDPRFLSWLDQTDGLTGETRRTLLTRAYDRGASDRCAAIFKAFLADRVPQRQRAPAQQLPFQKDRRRQPTIAASELDGRKRWSRAEIAAFYQDVRRGRYDGREVEKGRIEAEILNAAKSGRIRDPVLQVDLK